MSGIVNAYRQKSAEAVRHALVITLLLAIAPAWAASQSDERSVKPVTFAKGKSSATITGHIEGRRYIDHTLRAAAGQTLTVALKAGSRSAYFNLLPPGSPDAAMAIGELIDNRFSGLLPDDGVYTIRVFLNRAAARRNAASDYTLKVGAGGTALKPVRREGRAGARHALPCAGHRALHASLLTNPRVHGGRGPARRRRHGDRGAGLG
jgi:hypothetical protein